MKLAGPRHSGDCEQVQVTAVRRRIALWLRHAYSIPMPNGRQVLISLESGNLDIVGKPELFHES